MMPFLSAVVCALALQAVAQPSVPIIIDTDAGSDDLLAIAFLLSRPDARIEAITVVNGLAHVDAGARNVARLLKLSGHPEIPVFAGAAHPSVGSAEFPAQWRRTSDDLPGVELPKTGGAQKGSALEYLRKRLANGSAPVRILALGPLTNLAEAMRGVRPAGVREIVIMGGAIRARGNLSDGGLFKTDNKYAEWNIFVDPAAADSVFRSGAPITLVPLDATNQVPVNAAFAADLQSRAKGPLGRFVGQVLRSDKESIDGGYFYAWDPLAAVALVAPGVVTTEPMRIEIRRGAKETGRTVAASGAANAQVAMHANSALFRSVFLEALTH
jgi:pyrimidine-specific ribonucleoside hydrolase